MGAVRPVIPGMAQQRKTPSTPPPMHPALRSPYVRLEACQTRWHERAGHSVYGARTPDGAPLAWPVTRAGFRAAVAWCEAANAELPVRPAVPCRRMRLR
jgi:hypothetical protein